jgi:hypothetical protein
VRTRSLREVYLIDVTWPFDSRIRKMTTCDIQIQTSHQGIGGRTIGLLVIKTVILKTHPNFPSQLSLFDYLLLLEGSLTVTLSSLNKKSWFSLVESSCGIPLPKSRSEN